MKNKEIMFIGFDIHNIVKGLSCQLLTDCSDMTEGESKAYKLGINNVLSLLDQVLNEMIVDEYECYNNVAVHVSGLDVMTEFLTIDKLIKNDKEEVE